MIVTKKRSKQILYPYSLDNKVYYSETIFHLSSFTVVVYEIFVIVLKPLLVFVYTNISSTGTFTLYALLIVICNLRCLKRFTFH